jgi:quercetin 2,3-dioxygenase
MKAVLHRSSERGVSEHGWLHSRFSFSFAHWYNPTRMGFGTLRVINDDIIDPESGFDLHPHDNMEIITIVMSGAITHGDSMGNQKTVQAGDVQVMSAGTGVVHSEQNISATDSLHLFQIWILPHTKQVSPRYDQKSFGKDWSFNTTTLFVSPDARDESLMIHQDAFVSRAQYSAGTTTTYKVNQHGNGVYILVVSGMLRIEWYELHERDAIGISEIESFDLEMLQDTRCLIFEVPM